LGKNKLTPGFILLFSMVGSVISQDDVQSSFARAKVLIEANCADCAHRSQEALEQGIDLGTKAMNAGYPDRAAVLRLLVDAYGTLGVVFLKPNTPERTAAFQHRQDTLKQLIEAVPTDANIRYEYVHWRIGNTESRLADSDERIDRYRQILAIDPNHEKARFDLAQDLFAKGEDDEALALMRGLLLSSNSESLKIYSQTLDRFLQAKAKSMQVVAPVTFSGKVSRGESFEHSFNSGLVFLLSAMGDLGWRIGVAPGNSRNSDYAEMFTPPLRGRTVLDLCMCYGVSARDLVNLYSSGSSFRFVLTPQGYERAAHDISIILGHEPLPPGKTYEEVSNQAGSDMEQIPYCVGVFRILDSRLVRTGQDQEAIDWLKFEVELCSGERQ
jgi:tetratricopeptide (TPR) repeat protein